MSRLPAAPGERYLDDMRAFCSFAMVVLALVAMAGPGLAAGLCAHRFAEDVPAAVSPPAAPVLPGVPSPCETLGGKRLLPAGPVLDDERFEIDGAMLAQWARGLADQPMRPAVLPAMEPPPPRAA